MQELSHYMGDDLVISATGDLQTVDNAKKGQQRILRRLLTNPIQYDARGNAIAEADYIFHPNYGAGLGSFIGKTLNMSEIRAVIRGQILLEDAVAKVPEPVIILKEIPSGVSCIIQYADSTTNAIQNLNFDVTK